ncbi:MAG TPA: hypothetical protein V6C89_21920 [Drouetiella sp.]
MAPAKTEKPNLFIRFHRSVWEEPDPKLLNQLYILSGSNTWLPDEVGGEKHGPYVRLKVPAITGELTELLSNSLNVWEWDDKPFFRVCSEHKLDDRREITEDEKQRAGNCGFCGKPADWIAC